MALKIHPTSSFNFSFTSLSSSFRSHFGLRGSSSSRVSISSFKTLRLSELIIRRRRSRRVSVNGVSAALKPLDLNEDNVRQVLADARTEFLQIFDTSVGITGEAELVEVDGPFVKISLKGRFWHERSLVLARLGNYLKQRIPEILEVDIEDEKQLDDSPENF